MNDVRAQETREVRTGIFPPKTATSNQCPCGSAITHIGGKQSTPVLVSAHPFSSGTWLLNNLCSGCH